MSAICASAWEESKSDMTEDTVKARVYLEFKDEALAAGLTEAESEEYAKSMTE